MLAESLGKDGLGYMSSAADKDLWIEKEVLLDGKKYYSMVLVYVDDILCSIHKETSVVIDTLASIYVIKKGSIGPPHHFLGKKIEKVQTQVVVKGIWATHSGDYCKAAITNLEKTLTADGKSLSQYGDGKCPYLSSFHPEIVPTLSIEGGKYDV